MRFVMMLAATALMTAPIAIPTAAVAESKMQACAAQWNQMKAAGKTAGVDYRQFSSQCMKGSAAAPAAKPAAAAAKPAAAKPAASKTAPMAKTSGQSPQNRMKACGAKWQQMKAAGQTKNTTYQQFSAQCLKG